MVTVIDFFGKPDVPENTPLDPKDLFQAPQTTPESRMSGLYRTPGRYEDVKDTQIRSLTQEP